MSNKTIQLKAIYCTAIKINFECITNLVINTTNFRNSYSQDYQSDCFCSNTQNSCVWSNAKAALFPCLGFTFCSVRCSTSPFNTSKQLRRPTNSNADQQSKMKVNRSVIWSRCLWSLSVELRAVIYLLSSAAKQRKSHDWIRRKNSGEVNLLPVNVIINFST